MYKFPKIRQFGDVVREVKKHPALAPTGKLVFIGSVKLHGTNASIVFEKDKPAVFQSRNNILTPDLDNHGFARFMSQIDLEPLRKLLGDDVVVYGEWAGAGVQRGVGISQLQKAFYIFEVYDLATEKFIFDFPSVENINDYIHDLRSFWSRSIVIDFDKPEVSQNELIEITTQIESQCPVAKRFDHTGYGEGVVWRSVDNNLRFKVKGEKHSKSKVRILTPVDEAEVSAVNSLAEQIMTEDRLLQGLDYLDEMHLDHEKRYMGDFLKFVVRDCLDEETALIEESGLDKKKISKKLSGIARNWFIRKLAQF